MQKAKNGQYSRFVKYAWFVVFYTVLVILWGAVVRATGSGAGCGNHWPICNGQVIPRADSVEVLIEFSHRVTSAFSGLLVLIMLVWAYRLKPVSRFVRIMAVLSFIFILIEGGIGAALVRLELVEDNATVLRAWAIGLHLINTLVLLFWQVLTAWGAMYTPEQRRYKANSAITGALAVGLIGFCVLSAAGAVTALGDTLLMSGSLDALGANANEHFIVQMRVYHPVIAIIVSIYLVAFGYWMLQRNYPERVQFYNQAMIMLIALQTGVGILNIYLKAPVWMQVTHLLIADTLWIVIILFTANALTSQPEEITVSSRVGELQPEGTD